MKPLKWVFILFIPLNLLIILISFAFPGNVGFIDTYQVWVQKMVIHQIDNPHSMQIFQQKQADAFSNNAIQYAELTPYWMRCSPEPCSSPCMEDG